MTPEGHRRIVEEQNHILKVLRPQVVEGVATAAAEGDRSENAEYIYGKKRLREIDKRLRYLGSLIKDVQLIDPRNIRSDRVEFGATVTICDEEGVEKTWTIVGYGEADVDQKTISWKSPLAQALRNKRVGDVVLLERPAGEMEYEIIRIAYGGHVTAE
ncbi:MAG: GreA/GreB family elongation factor [Oligoflexus sp.]